MAVSEPQWQLFETIAVPQHHVNLVVGPMDLWETDNSVRCLAVGGADGLSVAFLPEQSAGGPWTEFLKDEGWDEGEPTSLRDIRNPREWARGGDRLPAVYRRAAREHGAEDALGLSERMLQEALDAALKSLDTRFRAVIEARPELPLKTASTLARYARPRGVAAFHYMCSALALEALGILNAAAEQIRLGVAMLADTITEGRSLQSLLMQQSVPAFVHRATLLEPIRSKDLSGQLFFAMCTAAGHTLHSIGSEDAKTLLAVADFFQRVFSCEVPDAELWGSTLRTLLTRKKPLSTSEALALIEKTLEEISARMKTLEGSDSPPKKTILMWTLAMPLEQMGQYDARQALIAEAVLHFSQTLRRQIASSLAQHPRVPPGFDAEHCVALDSQEVIAKWGRRLGNCLSHAREAAGYISRAVALYALEIEGVNATVALRLAANRPEVAVFEVEAEKSAPLHAVFQRAAWDLAIACSQPEALEAFFEYEDACKELGQSYAIAGIAREGFDLQI